MCAISTADQMDQEATSSDDDDVFSDGSSYIDFENEYSSSDEQNTVEECEEDDSNHAISNSTNVSGNAELPETAENNFQVIGQERVPPTVQSRSVVPLWVDSATLFATNIAENLAPLNSLTNLPPELLDTVKKEINFWFPVQQVVLPILLQEDCRSMPQRDIVISSPTGSGKTLAYILPILNGLRTVTNANSVFALIVAPVQNLVVQIYQEFLKFNANAKIVSFDGSSDYSSERNLLFPNKSKVSQAHILIATPGRLVEHLVDDNGHIDLTSLRYLVVDEADRMQDTARMEWLGLVERRANVQPSNILNIKSFTNNYHNRWLQKILVSATLSLDVDNLHSWRLLSPRLFRAESNKCSKSQTKLTNLVLPSTLDYQTITCKIGLKPALLYNYLKNNKWSKVVIFVNERTTGHRLCVLLSVMCKDRYEVAEFSSNLFGKRRVKVLKHFKEGTSNILIASDLLSRGIDIPALDCVINYEAPKNERIFLHRAGRTARALMKGTLLTFVTKEERMKLNAMLQRHNLWSNEGDKRDMEKLITQKDMRKFQKALRSLQSHMLKRK